MDFRERAREAAALSERAYVRLLWSGTLRNYSERRRDRPFLGEAEVACRETRERRMGNAGEGAPSGDTFRLPEEGRKGRPPKRLARPPGNRYSVTQAFSRGGIYADA